MSLPCSRGRASVVAEPGALARLGRSYNFSFYFPMTATSLRRPMLEFVAKATGAQ